MLPYIILFGNALILLLIFVNTLNMIGKLIILTFPNLRTRYMLWRYCTLRHCFKYISSLDHKFDPGHNSFHCLEVLAWIKNHYRHCGTKFSRKDELLILEAAALFHELDDEKLDQLIAANAAGMEAAMKKDGLRPQLQDVVKILVVHSSFKKLKIWDEIRKAQGEPSKYEALSGLLSSADLAEAVGWQALERSFHFHQNKLFKLYGTLPTNQQVYANVCLFYYNKENGIKPRFNAIKVLSIKNSVDGIVNALEKEICDIFERENLKKFFRDRNCKEYFNPKIFEEKFIQMITD